MKEKIFFMGSPEFAIPSLKKILEAGYEISAVFTQPDKPSGRKQKLTSTPVKIFALEKKLRVLEPKNLKDPCVKEAFEKEKPSCVVVVAYGKLIPVSILELLPNAFLNIHPSLLPLYRGPSPIQSVIVNNEEKTAVSIMLLDKGMDSGHILLQEGTNIFPEDTFETLQTRLSEIGAELIVKALDLFFAKKLSPIAQNKTRATTCKLIEKKDGEISSANTALEIHNKTRAFAHWPGVFFAWKEKQIKILQTRLVDENIVNESKDSPLFHYQQRLFFNASDKPLEVLQIQPEGKKTMDAKSFINGYFGK